MTGELDDNLVGQGAAFLAGLRAKLARDLAQIDRLRAIIQALEQAIPDLGKQADTEAAPPKYLKTPQLPEFGLDFGTPISPPDNGEWASRLRGLTQYEALVRIAKDNGGVLRISDARDILIKAGLSKGSPRNVYGSIYNKLRLSDEFAWISEGTYRLIFASPPSADDHGSERDGRVLSAPAREPNPPVAKDNASNGGGYR